MASPCIRYSPATHDTARLALLCKQCLPNTCDVYETQHFTHSKTTVCASLPSGVCLSTVLSSGTPTIWLGDLSPLFCLRLLDIGFPGLSDRKPRLICRPAMQTFIAALVIEYSVVVARAKHVCSTNSVCVFREYYRSTICARSRSHKACR